MADDDLDDEDEEDEDAEDEGEDDEDDEDSESSDSSGKKKLFIIVGAAIVLVIGGIGGAYVAGLLDPVIEIIAGGEPEQGEGSESAGAVFYDLPELLVNLNTGGRKSTFLKIRVALELERLEDIPKVEEMMPRIIDNFQVYLRELRIEDLKGSAGMYRLREELLTRVAAAAAPAQVNDVLFKEMLVQ
jgi:flagellar protein FliL